MQQTFQLFDDLNDADYQALKADIAKRGVLVPVELDEDGNILDGHHRVRACEELNRTSYPRVVRSGMTDAEKRSHVRALNIHRRHLTSEQKRHVIAEELKDNPDRTDREVARDLGVSHNTVKAVRQTQEAVGQLDQQERRTGKDGKSYKAAKPATKPHIVVHTPRDEKRATEALRELGTDAPAKPLDLKRAERIARENRVTEVTPVTLHDGVGETRLELVHSDFRDAGVPDAGSVDLILTDPPYPSVFLPLWSELSEVAATVLKPGGLLVAYSGQFHLPEVISRLSEHLGYVWCGSLVTFGQHNNVQRLHVRSRAKPLLFFANGTYEPDAWFDDCYESEGREKADHDWQQSVGAARYYIETLTTPGALVYDPFLGSGTTAVACKQAGRSFIGCDVDPAAVAAARERVA